MKCNGEKFFTYVWRFNALLIATVGVVGLLMALFGAVMFIKKSTRERTVTNIVNVGKETKVKEEFVLGFPYAIESSDYIRLPLYRDQSYDISYYSKSSGGNEVNYLFLNTITGDSAWLLPATNQLFIQDVAVVNVLKESADKKNKVVALLYAVVEKDTDGDQRLTNKDAIAIAVSAPDGSGYKKLVEGIDRLYAIKQIADDKVVILYQKNKDTISEIYSVPSISRISKQTVPQVNLE